MHLCEYQQLFFVISKLLFFSHRLQTPPVLCCKLLFPAHTPHGPVCHSQCELHPTPPGAWRWSSYHCRCLLLDQSRTEEGGDEKTPTEEQERDQECRCNKYYVLFSYITN